MGSCSVFAEDSEFRAESRALLEAQCDEPLLHQVEHVRPFRYPDVYKLYQAMRSDEWNVDELRSFDTDALDYARMDPALRHSFNLVMVFFEAADKLVGLNMAAIANDLGGSFEVRTALVYQAAMEGVHEDAYSLMIQEIANLEEINPIRDSLKMRTGHPLVPALQAKIDVTQRYEQGGSEVSLAERIAFFALVEAIFFSVSFAWVDFVASLNLLPVVVLANRWIMRDEAMHVRLGAMLYSKLQNKLSPKAMYALVERVVEAESAFARVLFPHPYLTMNAADLCEHVRFAADLVLVQLGYKPLYRVPRSPLAFVSGRAGHDHPDFFATVSTTYNTMAANLAAQGVLVAHERVDDV